MQYVYIECARTLNSRLISFQLNLDLNETQHGIPIRLEKESPRGESEEIPRRESERRFREEIQREDSNSRVVKHREENWKGESERRMFRAAFPVISPSPAAVAFRRPSRRFFSDFPRALLSDSPRNLLSQSPFPNLLSDYPFRVSV